MPIKMRLAQDVPERAGEDGEDGVSGVDGEAGEPGEAGADLTALPPIYIDANASNVCFIQQGTNATYRIRLSSDGVIIALPGSPDGVRFRIELWQDDTGGRTVSWSGDIRWEGGTAPTLSTDPNHMDVIEIETWRGEALEYNVCFGKGILADINMDLGV